MIALQVSESKLEAAALHKSLIVINARDPTFLLYGLTHEEKPAYLDKVKRGGLTGICVDAAWVDDDFRTATIAVENWCKRIRQFGWKDAQLVLKGGDIISAKQRNAVGFILTLQSPAPIGDNVDFIDAIYKLGIRNMQLTYQRRTLIGDGGGERTDAGLTVFGIKAIEEMNRVGMLIDLSHSGYKTSMEAVEQSKEPVIFSHSNSYSICKHPRNLKEEQMKAVAEKGGVIGVSTYSDFLKEKGGTTGTSIKDYLMHVDYAVKTVGIDHVGVGLDVGEDRTPKEIELIHGAAIGAGPASEHRYCEDVNSSSKVGNITAALLERGYSKTEIQKIVGENFLHVFERVWK